MLAITNIDVFALMNGLLQRYPRKKQPKVYYTLNQYFATSPQREHALVLDATVLFEGVFPKPLNPVEGDVINWDVIDTYLDSRADKLPVYKYKRPDIIADMLAKAAASNDKHALSAMLSNFTPTSRPQVRQKVIEFLQDPSAKKFELSQALKPKRGRAVEYYLTATGYDYTELKEQIKLPKPPNYESRYWASVIAKQNAAKKV